MGYNFIHGASRRYVVEYLTQPRDRRVTLRHCLVGNVLWAVVDHTHSDGQVKTYLNCYLIGKSGGEWGYKDIGEACHPAYYSCPLAYLDLAPVANEEWRAGVRAYHEARNRTFEIGDVLIFPKSVSVPQVRVVGKERAVVIGEYAGQQYRVRRSILAKVVEVVKAAATLPSAQAGAHG